MRPPKWLVQDNRLKSHETVRPITDGGTLITSMITHSRSVRLQLLRAESITCQRPAIPLLAADSRVRAGLVFVSKGLRPGLVQGILRRRGLARQGEARRPGL